MNEAALIDGLIGFVCLLGIITVHEFGHAWVAWKCGDDTAQAQGRVTLSPAAHIDLLGTIILPLLAVALAASGSGLAGFIIGWGKPVPVNVNNLWHRRWGDILVSAAGPAMNVVLALAAMSVVRLGASAHVPSVEAGFLRLAQLSLFLCFFNLLPIPPLDGSRVVWNLFRLSEEMFLRVTQYGLILILIAVQANPVQQFLGRSTDFLLGLMARAFGL